MHEKPLTLMCVQPSIKYYAWQIEVMLTNFKNLSIHTEFNIDCLFAFNKNESDWEEKVALIHKVKAKFEGIADFYFYEDTREYPISYISSIRPNVLKQHYKAFPELSNKPVFYHDCDVVFTKFPLFLHNYQQDDMNWYVSDTISYIGHDYIKSKGDDVLAKMCEIIGINESLVKEKQNESGGAQYIMKGVDYSFFHKVEKDCERLYKEISQLSNIKLNEDRITADPNNPKPPYHPLQIWCSDMWCILWNAWQRGYKTNIIPEMDFCWGTDSLEKWNEKTIFHNAGVVGQNDKLFYKGAYTDTYPYEIEDDFNKESASYKYFEIIKSIGKNSCVYDK